MNHENLTAGNIERSWTNLIDYQSRMSGSNVSRETPVLDIDTAGLPREFGSELWTKLEAYAGEVLLANERINLVSRRAPAKQILDNVLDGILLGVLIHNVSRETGDGILLVDGGTGSGVPGIPAQMTMSQLRQGPSLVLVDSQLKKQDFLDALIRKLDLEDTLVFRGRLENPRLRKVCESEWPSHSWLLCTKAFAGLEQTIRWARSFKGGLSGAFLIKGPLSIDEVEGFPFERRAWALEAIHRCYFPLRESHILELTPVEQ